MKKYLYIAVAVVVTGVLTFAFLSKGNARTLGVNDVASDPAAFTGNIAITGVMAGVSRQDPGIFGIMDKKELQCTTPNCNKFILPIRYQGKLPVLGDEVRLTGSFANDGRGYMFSATTIKVLRNHKIGG